MILEVFDNQGFAVSASDITQSRWLGKSLASDAFGAIQADSNTTSATWNDSSIAIATFDVPSIPEVVGYRTQLIPSNETSSFTSLVSDGALYSYESEFGGYLKQWAHKLSL